MRRTGKCSFIQLFEGTDPNCFIFPCKILQLESNCQKHFSKSKTAAKTVKTTPIKPLAWWRHYIAGTKEKWLHRNMGHRWDCSTLWSTHDPRAAHRAKTKFKLARRALRPSLREKKRNDFNLPNILKVYWKFYNCLINRKLVLNTPISPTLHGCEEFLSRNCFASCNAPKLSS